LSESRRHGAVSSVLANRGSGSVPDWRDSIVGWWRNISGSWVGWDCSRIRAGAVGNGKSFTSGRSIRLGTLSECRGFRAVGGIDISGDSSPDGGAVAVPGFSRGNEGQDGED